jgi:hypothetical protein
LLDVKNNNGTCSLGVSIGWVLDSFNLTDVQTQGELSGDSEVWIAFVFSSDSLTHYLGGAFIDNIVLRKCDSNCGTAKPGAYHDGIEVQHSMARLEH